MCWPGEHQTVGFVGVARDIEGAVVLAVMMERAESCEVVGVRGPAVLPVDDVVDFQSFAGAAGVAAGAVTVEHGTTRVTWDGAGDPADIDGRTAGDDIRMDGAVAQDLRTHGGGERRTAVEPRLVRIDVDVHAVRVGSAHARDGGHGPAADLEQCVGPRDLWVPRSEERIVGLAQRRFDLGPFEGVDIGVKVEPSVVIVMHGDPVHRSGWCVGLRLGLTCLSLWDLIRVEVVATHTDRNCGMVAACAKVHMSASCCLGANLAMAAT